MSKEYIEKEALLAQVRESRANNTHLNNRDRHAHDTEHRHFEYMIFTAKPADVKPVVRGEWINHGSYQECSVCHEERPGFDSYRFFCPNCGADMRSCENLKADAEYADAGTMMSAT